MYLQGLKTEAKIPVDIYGKMTLGFLHLKEMALSKYFLDEVMDPSTQYDSLCNL